MAKPKKTELEKAHAKRISGWFKNSADCVFAAKRGIREGKPLSAISNVNIAILELKKVKRMLLSDWESEHGKKPTRVR